MFVEILIGLGIVVGVMMVVTLALIIHVLLQVKGVVDMLSDIPELTPAEVKQMNMINEEDNE